MNDKKFLNDAARAFLAIVILAMLAIAPALVIAVWRMVL